LPKGDFAARHVDFQRRIDPVARVLIGVEHAPARIVLSALLVKVRVEKRRAEAPLPRSAVRALWSAPLARMIRKSWPAWTLLASDFFARCGHSPSPRELNRRSSSARRMSKTNGHAGRASAPRPATASSARAVELTPVVVTPI
jgi:hypothetical protein